MNNRGQRLIRDISVETYPSRLETPRDDWGLLPPHSRETTPLEDTDTYDKKGEIGFFSGNPFVEITKGILHLYKEEYVRMISFVIKIIVVFFFQVF